MNAATSITVRVPLKIRRRPGRKTVVTPIGARGETALPTRADPALVKALARAFRYQNLLDEGRYASITEMAAAEKIDRGYLGRILLLALLSPSAIDALLQRPALAAELRELRRAASLPWAEQEAALHLRPSKEGRGKE